MNTPYESGSTVIVKTVCYVRFRVAISGGSKLKATFKSFRARAISVLELNGPISDLGMHGILRQIDDAIGDETPFDQLPWPHKDLAEAALSTRMVTAGRRVS